MEMNKKFEMECREIYRAHPRLYRAALAPAGERGCMQYGLAIGPGWLGIVRRLSQEIEEIATRHGLTEEDWPRASQVKEKFGLLRFHVWGNFKSDAWADAWTEIQEAKEAAEVESGKVCERCGAPGKMRRAGWWHVYCDHCEDLYERGLL